MYEERVESDNEETKEEAKEEIMEETKEEVAVDEDLFKGGDEDEEVDFD